MSIFIEVSGWVAAALCVLMYCPQTFKTIRTKRTDELAKTTFVLVALGTVFWAFYSASVDSFQGWLSNFVIFFLMLPILFYLFSKKTFVLLTIVLGLVLCASVLVWVFSIALSVPLVYFLVAVSSFCTGVPFYFQTFKTFKTKATDELSLVSSVLIFTGCFLWSVYWGGQLFLHNLDGTFLIAFISSLAAAIIQIPLMVLITKY